MQLSDFKAGDRLRLVNYGRTDLAYRQRLLSMGLTPGVELSIVRLAPLGCPIHIEVRGTSLILRKKEARYLVLEKI